MFKVPNSLRLPALFVRPRSSKDASEGRLETRDLGLGGLRDRVREEAFLVSKSWEVDRGNTFGASGMGGIAGLGDWLNMEYLEGFLRSERGGDPRPVGVDTGDGR
jgi:hypothetical protein